MDKGITFDEADANYILMMACNHLKSKSWNPLDEEDWEELKAVKEICDRIGKYLDGEDENYSAQ